MVSDAMLKKLVSMQYERNDINFVRNKFRVKGDVVDIFLFSTRQDDADLFLRLYYKFHCGISRELAQRAVQQGRRSPGKPLLALAAALADEDWLRQRIESLYAQLSLLPGDTSAQALGRINEDMGYREHLKTKRADEGKLDILMAIARSGGVDVAITRVAETRHRDAGLLLQLLQFVIQPIIFQIAHNLPIFCIICLRCLS